MGIASEAQKKANKKYLKSRKRVCVDLDPDVYGALYELASSKSYSIAQYIRELVMYEVMEVLADE